MDWLMLRDSARKAITKCYMDGIGVDLTDEQVEMIVTTYSKIDATLCTLAWHKKIIPHKEFVSNAEWKTIQRIDDGE